MKVDATIHPQTPMREVLEIFPGAQRALFRRYHIGGCSSCGFSPDETLAQVCARNGNLDVAEVLAHIQSSREQDAKILISPKELAALLQKDKSVKLIDVHPREFLFLQHQGRSGPVCGSDEGNPKILLRLKNPLLEPGGWLPHRTASDCQAAADRPANPFQAKTVRVKPRLSSTREGLSQRRQYSAMSRGNLCKYLPS